MEVTMKIDERSKEAKAVLEILKTFSFVRFVNNENQKILPSKKSKLIKESNKAETKEILPELYSKEQFLEEISKKVNKSVAEKWYKKSGITY